MALPALAAAEGEHVTVEVAGAPLAAKVNDDYFAAGSFSLRVSYPRPEVVGFAAVASFGAAVERDLFPELTQFWRVAVTAYAESDGAWQLWGQVGIGVQSWSYQSFQIQSPRDGTRLLVIEPEFAAVTLGLGIGVRRRIGRGALGLSVEVWRSASSYESPEDLGQLESELLTIEAPVWLGYTW